MKYLLQILLYFIVSRSAIGQGSNELTGKWIWWDADSTSSFNLELVQINDSIYGDYCAIAYNGRFIDCWLPEDYNTPPLTGSMKNDKYNVRYLINYALLNSLQYANATLQYYPEKDILMWKLLDSDNVTYCPEEAVLKRIK